MNKDELQEKLKKIYWDNNKSSTLVGSMGVGKTILGIKIANEIKKKSNILVISPKKLISGEVKGGNVWENELKKFPSNHKWDFITIHKALNIKYIFDEYSLIILDEIHEMLSPIRIKVIELIHSLNIQTLGLTGTPDLNNEFKKEAYEKYCPIIYTYLDAAEDGLINKTKIFVYNHYLDNKYQYELSTKAKSWKQGELEAYTYLNNIIETSTNNIKDTYYKEVLARAISLALKNPLYESDIRKLIGTDLDSFRDTYWSIMKEKKLPYDLYKLFRVIQGDDYAKLGMKAAYYAKIAPESLKKDFYRYIWARDTRKQMLLRLDSTSDIARTLTEYITEANNKVIIFSEENNQVEKITLNTYFSKNTKVDNHLNLIKFNKGSILELGTSKALSLGVNLKDVKYGILESYVGSDTRINQNKGRLHRLLTDDNAIFIVIRIMNTQSEQWFEKIKDGFNSEITYFDDLEILIKNLNL